MAGKRIDRQNERSSFSQWCDAIAGAGKDYDRKRKEALYVAEAMAVGEEGLKGFDALSWGRQWHFVEQALNMLETKKTVDRAHGIVADEESSKVLAKMREIDHG